MKAMELAAMLWSVALAPAFVPQNRGTTDLVNATLTLDGSVRPSRKG